MPHIYFKELEFKIFEFLLYIQDLQTKEANDIYAAWNLSWTGNLSYWTSPDEIFHVTQLRYMVQGSHRLEKYLNFEGLHEKSLKIKYALKSTGKSLKWLEKSLNFTIFCRT